MRYTILLTSSLLALLVGCSPHNEKHREQSEYKVTQPMITDTVIYKEYVAQIHSFQHIELRALEKGYLQNVYVDEGKFVRKGQLLFHIMPIIYQAEMQKAQAEVRFAEIEYKNTKALADSHVVSKNELALAKAKLEREKAQLALAQAHLKFTEIRAPFDGMVGRFKDVRLGSLVDEGELLTTLSDNSKMWVYFNVPETEYLNYATNRHPDNKLKVLLKLANNTMYGQEGIVETIEADFNNETGNIAFRATFSNAAGILRNGETGSVLMPVTLKNAMIIPQEATFEVLDKKYVYVVNNKNILQSTEIKVEAEMPHLYVIASGLKADDKILVEGLRNVKNNQQIRYKVVPIRTVISELQHLHAE